ncbi:hypothetical protein NKR23_g49 [Pleurostoma richardsiae]|uniref:DUF6604 domain-containing protein n=1 Tax=Pleurostoma richardsiae TaxID=41990 RepID=A0AA38RVF1_9PEZI|nr:hypothetical protein NKR23_g49 [Pleurostoma richardsiae]
MAKAIANPEPQVMIPKALGNLFRRAIDARKSDLRHAHFTDVLASAWETLRPFEKQEPLKEFANRFSGLRVDDLPEHDFDTEHGAAIGKDDVSYNLTDANPATIVKSEEDAEADFLLAIFSFMMELGGVRKYVRFIWNRYKEGKTELILCSLLTNTAIQLETISTLMHALWEDKAMVKAARGKQAFLPDIEHCVEEGVETELPETFCRIRRMLPCFQFVSEFMRTTGCFGNNEVTAGFEVVFRTETVPVWVAFGNQVPLDIQDELHLVLTRPLEEVQQHAREKVSEFEGRNLEQEPLRRDREGTRHLEARLGVYEFLILGDPFGQHTLPAYLRYDVTGSNIVSWNNFFKEPDNILRINPVRCRVLKYGVHLILHPYAVGFEMKSHVITSMIHLYAACRFAYPEDPVWPDMEYFLHH